MARGGGQWTISSCDVVFARKERSAAQVATNDRICACMCASAWLPQPRRHGGGGVESMFHVAVLTISQWSAENMVGRPQFSSFRRLLSHFRSLLRLYRPVASALSPAAFTLSPAAPALSPWDYRRSRRGGSSASSGSGASSSRYRCDEIGSWSRAQDLLRQGHTYLDRDGDGEACEALR